MLEGSNLIGLGVGFDGRFITAINQLGLTGNHQMALDIGDGNSYTSGQTVTDLSAASNDVFRGATSGSEASDPTFNGTAGKLSAGEYFSVDGGDFFRFTAKPTWIDTFHKDNGVFTLFFGHYCIDAGGGAPVIFGNDGNSGSNVGFQIAVTASESIRFRLANGSTITEIVDSADNLPQNAWSIWAISVDEAGGAAGSFIDTNGTIETFDAAYTSPSSSAATYTPEIAAAGNAGNILESGHRFALVGIWDTNLSQAQVAALRLKMKPRFGL